MTARLRQFVEGIAGLYLLFMGAYLVARLLFKDSIWPLNLLNTFLLLLFTPVVPLFMLGVLMRSRRALLCLIPIALVFAVWFGPRFLPRSSDAPAQLRVMSNNIWQGNRTPDKIVTLAQSEQPDVILLQEVSPAVEQGALAALAEAYPYQTAQPDLSRISIYNAVNLTLSRRPFVISEEVQLDLPLIPLIYRNVVEVDGGRVALYNVHLSSPDGGSPRFGLGRSIYPLRVALAFDDSERNRQIDTLLAHLATEPYPYLIAGDFNTSDLSATYNRLAGQMHDSFGEVGFGLGGTWPVVEALRWANFIPPLIRMDYIWSGNGLQAVRAWRGAFVGSDHLPVLADFVVSDNVE